MSPHEITGPAKAAQDAARERNGRFGRQEVVDPDGGMEALACPAQDELEPVPANDPDVRRQARLVVSGEKAWLEKSGAGATVDQNGNLKASYGSSEIAVYPILSPVPGSASERTGRMLVAPSMALVGFGVTTEHRERRLPTEKLHDTLRNWLEDVQAGDDRQR